MRTDPAARSAPRVAFHGQLLAEPVVEELQRLMRSEASAAE